ncbi:hypothetical protein KSP39_PZI023107 [Platanthera zijinensis]|uniref:Uncharacterized protein n=1 Tax=Platanthera zijinensis TaxID=2320716 RepID=A0AAP0AW90_9ASPA
MIYELVVKSDILEEHIATASRFRARLRAEIQSELIPHLIKAVEQVFQLYENYLRLAGSRQTTHRSDTLPASPQMQRARLLFRLLLDSDPDSVIDARAGGTLLLSVLRGT